MNESAMLWWIAGFILLITEMTTGTFYMLILGLSALIAGLFAWMGFIVEIQILIGIILASLGCYGVSRYRNARTGKSSQTQNMDVGGKVTLLHREGRDLRVHYRGTEWQAELLEDPQAAADGELPNTLYIRAVRNNILIVSPKQQG